MRKLKIIQGQVKWTKVATKYLQQQTKSTRHIARVLAIPAHHVRIKLLELNLQEPNSKFSPKEAHFLLDNYQKYSYNEIAKELGKTLKEVRNQAIKLGIKKTQKIYPRERRIQYKTKKYVQDNYYTKTYLQMSSEQSVPLQTVCRLVRLLKKEGKIQSKGRWTPPKGCKPFYTNTKKTATSFKKGHMPHNYRPIGSERINSNGYTEVKIANPRKWEMKQSIIYKQHFGNIPPKHIVIFKDKNKQNFDIENLVCISRAEHIRLNYCPQKTGETNKKHYQKIKTAILLGKELTPDMPYAKKFM